MQAKLNLSALVKHLQGQTLDEFYMTIEEIESLVGPLPASARKYNQWWANAADTANRPQRKAMLQTPYDTFFRPSGGKVRFERKRN